MRYPKVTLCVIGICFVTITAHADLVFQPADLNPGDQYRLVFTTSTTRDAAATAISDYNAHVRAAAMGSPTVDSWGLTWHAIASTSTVSAIDNTNTPPTTLGISIYLVDGRKVADNYMDLWGGSLDTPINRTEKDSSPPLYFGRPYVWTGTSEMGMISNPLGSGAPGVGQHVSATFRWVREETGSTSWDLPIYAMSNVIIAVPEPGAFMYLTLVGFGFAGFAAVRQRFDRT